MAVGVCHQLIGLLAGGIKTHRMIHGLTLMKRQVAVASVHRTAGGIHQIAHAVMTTSFKDVPKSHEIALDVSSRILNLIANPRLGRQIHHHLGLFS